MKSFSFFKTLLLGLGILFVTGSCQSSKKLSFTTQRIPQQADDSNTFVEFVRVVREANVTSGSKRMSVLRGSGRTTLGTQTVSDWGGHALLHASQILAAWKSTTSLIKTRNEAKAGKLKIFASTALNRVLILTAASDLVTKVYELSMLTSEHDQVEISFSPVLSFVIDKGENLFRGSLIEDWNELSSGRITDDLTKTSDRALREGKSSPLALLEYKNDNDIIQGSLFGLQAITASYLLRQAHWNPKWKKFSLLSKFVAYPIAIDATARAVENILYQSGIKDEAPQVLFPSLQLGKDIVNVVRQHIQQNKVSIKIQPKKGKEDLFTSKTSIDTFAADFSEWAQEAGYEVSLNVDDLESVEALDGAHEEEIQFWKSYQNHLENEASFL